MKLPSPVKKKDPNVVKVPRTAQQSIPIRRIHRDGIWEVGNQYSRTWRFTDVNFSVADDDDKDAMLRMYVAFEKALPADAVTKISVVNKGLDPIKFRRDILSPGKKDGNDRARGEYNRMVMDKAAEGNNIIRERYITVSVAKRDIDEARTFFRRVASDLASHLRNLSSRLYELNNEERFSILHEFFRSGEEGRYSFDFDTLRQRGQDFCDDVCPNSIKFLPKHFELGSSKVGRVLFVKNFPSYLRDDFVKELADVRRNMIISINIQPIPTAVAMKTTQNSKLGIETDIAKFQQKQNANNNFSAVLPPQLLERREMLTEMYDELTNNDQRMTNITMTVAHIADSLAELDSDTESILSAASGCNCDLSILDYQQEAALNTTIPYGPRYIDVTRTMLTNSAAALVPFISQEIYHPHGIYYGVNPQTRNLIICDRRQLKNSNGFILGVSGSGKSFSAKLELSAIILNTDDDVIIADPEREYGKLIEGKGGQRFTIGTMDVFAHQTNVNMNNRIMLFDIFDLGSQLKSVGMLVMLDAILNRVIENFNRGRRTWIYIDEIYLFFANEYSTNFLEECWKRFRKKGAAATGITQNVSDCLRSPTARNMLANSEFLIMLSQAPTDQDELVNMLHISAEQLKFIDNAPEGQGLLKVGGCLAPFENIFPKDTELYRSMTTKVGE